MLKLPPIEKIYEAYSAIADERINLFKNYAVISSSDKTKSYIVSWSGNVYTSNDNSTYWQSYAGYPIIAVLMLQAKLPLDRNTANRFSAINWTKLNASVKRDYSKAVETMFCQQHFDTETEKALRAEVLYVYNALKNLDIEVKRLSKSQADHIKKGIPL